MSTAHPKVTTWASQVSIYATSAAAAHKGIDALEQFAQTLPASVAQISILEAVP